ncbi:MAG: hypothetical protein JO027_07345 [Solirubrobacterales bacterium]|nr:hypothetical protein [Solirubrobacterales bacterium]
MPICWPLAAEALDVVDDVEDEAAGAAAAVADAELVLDALPHPARTSADMTSAATPPALNFAVLRPAMISLPVRGFRATRQSVRVTHEDPGGPEILPPG